MSKEVKVQEKNTQEHILPKEGYDTLDMYIDSLETTQGALIQVLHKAQEIFGYLPRDVQLFVARRLGLSGAKVNGVVSFYTYFTQKPRGKYQINVCVGTACFVKGASNVAEVLQKRLKVAAGGITEDGHFSLNSLRCVGACGLAPLMMVDDKMFGRVKPEEIDSILSQYERERMV